jgi:hypothetical protein
LDRGELDWIGFWNRAQVRVLLFLPTADESIKIINVWPLKKQGKFMDFIPLNYYLRL